MYVWVCNWDGELVALKVTERLGECLVRYGYFRGRRRAIKPVWVSDEIAAKIVELAEAKADR